MNGPGPAESVAGQRVTVESGPRGAMRKPYLSEDIAYREADQLGDVYYQHGEDDVCEPDLARLFSWPGFPGSGQEILELGCGDGFHTGVLSARGCRVTGVDCSAAAIERARRNLDRGGFAASLLVADVCDIRGFEAHSQSAILDCHCLHCLVDPGARASFFATCHRLLAPDGALFLATMAAQPMGWAEAASGGPWQNEYALDGRSCWMQLSKPPGATSHIPMRIWITEELLRAEIAAAGLEIARFERFSPPADPEDWSFLAQLGRP
jgi:SAM-dependent methyltransferase